MTIERICRAGEGRRFDVAGSEVRVKVQAGEPDGAFSLIEWTIPPGAPAPPRHVHHEGSETFFILEGTLTFPMADKTVAAPAGTCLHIPPGTPHTLANETDVPVRALELFVPGSLMSLVEAVGEIFAAGIPPDPRRLQSVFAQHASEIVG